MIKMTQKGIGNKRQLFSYEQEKFMVRLTHKCWDSMFVAMTVFNSLCK